MKYIKILIGFVIILIMSSITLYLCGMKIDKSENEVVKEQVLLPEIEINLGYGIKLVDVSSVSGKFCEDGSDEIIDDMLAATFINTSDKTLQYGSINIKIGDKDYLFTISTLPPNEAMQAFEINRGTAPEDVTEVNAVANNLAFFQEEPESYEDSIKISTKEGLIILENISDEDINKEISVFYKNCDGDKYIGGITYRLRVAGLKAGEKVNMAASHATKETRIMFVSYGN